MSRILLLGAEGQVGWELQRSLAPLGCLTVASRRVADFSRQNALIAFVMQERPDIIVNAAAYTAVDKAEAEESLARQINADAVAALAQASSALNAWLAHYSTDYVFNGEGNTPFTEQDAPCPLNAYGRSKLAGEQAIRDSGCRHLIFRTSWVYAARGNNFVRTILRLAREREELKVVADQFGAPTSAELIADVTAHAIAQLGQNGGELSGTYHLAADAPVSWHEFARFIVEESLSMGLTLKLSPDRIHAIPASDYPLPAPRPANSRLATAKLQNTFGLRLPDWRHHARRTLRELIEGEVA